MQHGGNGIVFRDARCRIGREAEFHGVNVKTLVTRKSTCLAALGVLVLVAAPVRGSMGEPVPAVWKEQKLTFHYDSSFNIYTCSALRGRVADLMRAVGARDDVRVKAYHCDESMVPTTAGDIGGRGTWNASGTLSPRSAYPGQRPDTVPRQSAVVMITAMMPTEVTPEVRAELEKDKERRELIARVSGNPAARFNDPVMFLAERQQVTLSRKTLKLEPYECELVDQMATTVFRRLGLDIVRRNADCDRNGTSKIPPELVVESLMAAQPKPLQDDAEEAGDTEPPVAPAPAPAPAGSTGAPAPPPPEQ